MHLGRFMHFSQKVVGVTLNAGLLHMFEGFAEWNASGQ